MIDRLNLGIQKMDIELLKPAIEEAQAAGPEGKGLPRKNLKYALAARGKIKQIQAKLKGGIDGQDVAQLRSALAEGQKEGLPEGDLKEAADLKGKLEQHLAMLKVATQLLDVEVLKAAIKECEAAGLHGPEMDEALAAERSVDQLLGKLRTAIDGQDVEGVKAAIVDCGIEMLKTAIEACRAGNVSETELAEAMAAREKKADLSYEDRQRLLLSLKTCNEEEMRTKHTKVVSMLREAIKTGNDVPKEFDDLVNELIIDQLM